MAYHQTQPDHEGPFQETRAIAPRVILDNTRLQPGWQSDEVEDEQLNELLPPSLRGEYVVLKLVSRLGNYPLLLKVRQRSLKVLHAVKVWQPGMVGEPQEGSIQAALSAPGGAFEAISAVPQVQRFAMCPVSQQWYLVMCWIEGKETAALALDPQHVSQRTAILWFAALAEDLQRVHSLGYLHGDISPGNVLLSEHPERLTLLDYGNAGRLPVVQLQRWTPDFVAPELRLSQQATIQTDVWALAAVLVYVLCGAPPDNQGQLPAGLNAGAAVHGVLLRALHPSPAQRYQLCSEFAVALRGAAAARLGAESLEVLRTCEDCLRVQNRWFPAVQKAWESGGRGGSVFRRIAPGKVHVSGAEPSVITNSVPFHVLGEPLRLEDYRDLSTGYRQPWPVTGGVHSAGELQRASLAVCLHLTKEFCCAVQLPRQAELEYAIQFLKCAGKQPELQAIVGQGEPRHYLLSAPDSRQSEVCHVLRVQQVAGEIQMRQLTLTPDWCCTDLQALLVVHGHGGF